MQDAKITNIKIKKLNYRNENAVLKSEDNTLTGHFHLLKSLNLPVTTKSLFLPVNTKFLYLLVNTKSLYLPVNTKSFYLPVNT